VVTLLPNERALEFYQLDVLPVASISITRGQASTIEPERLVDCGLVLGSSFRSPFDNASLKALAHRHTETSVMAHAKLIDSQNALKDGIPALTPWTFVRAGGLANLLVATLVFIEFSAIALVNHDGKAFQLGLLLVPLMTVVIWGTAAVLFVGASMPKWLWMLRRRMIGTSRSSTSARSGVWDRWLDGPEPHDP